MNKVYFMVLVMIFLATSCQKSHFPVSKRHAKPDTTSISDNVPADQHVNVIVFKNKKTKSVRIISRSNDTIYFKSLSNPVNIWYIPMSEVDTILQKKQVIHTRFLFKGHFYSIVQTAAIDRLKFKARSSAKPSFFNSVSAISGYQFTRNLSAGLGLSYFTLDIPYNITYPPGSQYNNYVMKLENVSILPVFADLRVNIMDKRAVPFLNFDIGYNILLSQKRQDLDYDSYVNNQSLQTAYGGIHIAIGAGVRIALSKLIQIIPSLEYGYDDIRILYSHSGERPNIEKYMHFSNSSFRINLGIGFQYR